MQMQDCVGMGTQEVEVGFLVVVVVVFMVVVGVHVWKKKSVFIFGSKTEAPKVGGREFGKKILRYTYVDSRRVCSRWRGRSRRRPL